MTPRRRKAFEPDASLQALQLSIALEQATFYEVATEEEYATYSREDPDDLREVLEARVSPERRRAVFEVMTARFPDKAWVEQLWQALLKPDESHQPA